MPSATVTDEDVRADVEAMFTAAELCATIRFRGKKFWEKENADHDYCERVLRGELRFESVADHSWHLADCVLLVAPRFLELDITRCLALAVVHDKLELWDRDANPLGRDGSGVNTFAFDAQRSQKRLSDSWAAATKYLKTLSGSTQRFHRELLGELLADETIDARFVRAMDKLQVFTYLVRRKKGFMDNEHIGFNLRYAAKFVTRVPILTPYYDELVRRLLEKVAETRGVLFCDLWDQFMNPPQRSLPL